MAAARLRVAGAIGLSVAAMAAIVAASNVLVQYPFFPFGLADLLTWGAFTYPVAFLITDLTNRRFGPRTARLVVLCGFAVAVAMSVVLASPRIAIASGSAFLIAQLIDVAVFDRLRQGTWWRAPLISSALASAVDTALFFTLAFAASFALLGPNDPFAIEASPLLGFAAADAPRWVSWALGDLGVKMLVALAMLAPFSLLRGHVPPRETVAGGAAL